MKTLRDFLAEADRNHTAIGHFNFSELTVLKAATESAHELNVPVIVGVSEGERDFVGVREAAALVRTLREDYGLPVFLNADHTHSLSRALDAARARFDAIVFDLSSLPFEENIAQTREAVKQLKAIHPEMLVEGEIGDIGSGSEIHDKVPEASRNLTAPEEAKRFVAETGVDILAPAVGTMHGLVPSMVRGETQKRLNVERVREIKQAVRIFMTLHGGSGTNDEDLREGISAGLTIVHVNTDLRLAWRHGLDAALAKHPNEVAPYKLLPEVVESVKQVVAARIKVFNSAFAGSPAR